MPSMRRTAPASSVTSVRNCLSSRSKKARSRNWPYIKARAECVRLTRTEGIDAVCTKNHLQALVAPTSCLAWLTDYVNGDSAGGGCSTAPAVAGYPHITVPAGLVNGLPAGISFFGPAWSEPALIKVAYAFEQATKARRKPTFRAQRLGAWRETGGRFSPSVLFCQMDIESRVHGKIEWNEASCSSLCSSHCHRSAFRRARKPKSSTPSETWRQFRPPAMEGRRLRPR